MSVLPPAASEHPEHRAEQRHLDGVLAHVDAEAERLGIPSDAGADRRAGRVLNEMRRNQRDRMHEVRRQVYFGRLDLDGEGPYYIGRGVLGLGSGGPTVLNWRAEKAQLWYSASPTDRRGVQRKRHLRVKGPKLHQVRDEDLVLRPGAPPPPRLAPPEIVKLRPSKIGPPDEKPPPTRVRGRSKQPDKHTALQKARPAAPSGLTFDTVLDAIGEVRGGEMEDIVASIQADQHRLISDPIAGVLAIQGGPGTGKTAVALHRAAWLLFNHRDELANAGMLVVGPNKAFMDYVARVLPMLGEESVTQLAADRLVPRRARISKTDNDATAALKGDARMADVLHEALYNLRKRPVKDIEFTLAGRRIQLEAEAVTDALRETARTSKSYEAERGRFRSQLEAMVRAAFLSQRRPGLGTEDPDRAMVELRRMSRWQSTIRQLWPNATAETVLIDLLADDGALSRAAAGLLEPAEQLLLLRAKDDAVPPAFSAGDVALLDELGALLAGPPRVFGYVVVDEAQDLTPMQLRSVARRAAYGRMTLVGDIAQATGPVAYRSWREVADHLPVDGDARLAELVYGYRVPSEVMEIAERLLPQIAPDIQPPEAVRAAGKGPAFLRAAADDLDQVMVAEVRALLSELPGTMGLITTADGCTNALAVLEGAGIVAGDLRRDGLSRRVTVLSASRAKGLEFDSVLLVEPATIVAEGTHGLSELYVALTRPTQRLVVLHTQALPAALSPDASGMDEPSVAPTAVAPDVVSGGRLNDALALAQTWHGGQRRAGSATPTMAHILGVVALVLQDGGDEQEAVAAALHDGPASGGESALTRIHADFGEEIADVVERADGTPGDLSGSWTERQGQRLTRLERASVSVRRVALAEHVDELRALLRELDAHGGGVWERLEARPHDLLWQHRGLAEMFTRVHPGGVAADLARLVGDLAAQVERLDIERTAAEGSRELAPELAEMTGPEVEDAYREADPLLRELLEELALHPGNPRRIPEIERELEWPRGRMDVVLAEYGDRSRLSSAGHRPFRVQRSTPNIRWLWMDPAQADAVLTAATER